MQVDRRKTKQGKHWFDLSHTRAEYLSAKTSALPQANDTGPQKRLDRGWPTSAVLHNLELPSCRCGGTSAKVSPITIVPIVSTLQYISS